MAAIEYEAPEGPIEESTDVDNLEQIKYTDAGWKLFYSDASSDNDDIELAVIIPEQRVYEVRHEVGDERNSDGSGVELL